MNNRSYRQGPLTPEIQEQIADAEGLWKTGLRLQAVAPSVNQQPLSSTPSTSEPAPSTTSVALHDTPNSKHSEHGPGGRSGTPTDEGEGAASRENVPKTGVKEVGGLSYRVGKVADQIGYDLEDQGMDSDSKEYVDKLVQQTMDSDQTMTMIEQFIEKEWTDHPGQNSEGYDEVYDQVQDQVENYLRGKG